MRLDNINERVAGLTAYQPGKPIEELTRELGLIDVIKLASNENPRGPGPRVRAAIEGTVRDISRYPDGSGYRLKRALSEHLGVGTDQVTLGNGSNDVLELAARVAISPGTQGVFDAHCFVVYPGAVIGAHGEPIAAPSRDWGHDLDAMRERITASTRIVFIANPNNPTGTWIDHDSLVGFLKALPQTVWVVLDEAYCEYIARSDYPDGVRLQTSFPNLIVTRTFSKIHGLAGLRIGYSVSAPEFADLLNRIRQPFNASSMALAAAEAALDDDGFVATSKAINDAGMEQITAGLDALGIDHIPSIGNFVAMDCGRDAAPVYNALLTKGVIVRPLANYDMPRHLRISIGLARENASFLAALREVI